MGTIMIKEGYDSVKDTNGWNRLAGISSIISFLFFSYVILDLISKPDNGYELSIYSNDTSFFFIGTALGLLNGYLLITLKIFNKLGDIWIVGLFQVILCKFSIISLSALKGYLLYLPRSDVATYVSLAEDINRFNYITDYNIYPITSVFISQASQISNINTLVISKYLAPIFLALCILWTYSLSKAIINDKRYFLATIIASTPIFFAWFSTSIYHMLLSIVTFPLFFLFVIRGRTDVRFKLFIIIYLFLYPFFHPISAMVIIGYLVILFFAQQSLLNCYNRSYERIQIVTNKLLLTSITMILFYFMNQYIILRKVSIILLQIYGSLANSHDDAIITTSMYAANYVDKLGIIGAIKPILFMEFDELIYYALSIIAIYYILFKDRKNIYYSNLSIIYISFIGGSLFLLVLFLFFRIHTPDRLINLNWNMMLVPPLIGYLIYRSLLLGKNVKAILLICIIFILMISTTLSLYPSPITTRPNDYATVSELHGMKWLLIQKDPGLRTADVMTPVLRYADLIFGNKFRLERRDLAHRDLIFPDHFGAQNDSILPIDEERYLVITEYDKQAYTIIWKDIHRFNQTDFAKLDTYINTDNIYENGGFQAYDCRVLVHAQ